MSKKFLTDVIVQSTEMPAVAANRLATDLIEAIKTEITGTGRFTLPDFGSFVVRSKGRRVGRNPKTGVEVEIEPRQVMVFKPSNVLKARINGAQVANGADVSDDD